MLHRMLQNSSGVHLLEFNGNVTLVGFRETIGTSRTQGKLGLPFLDAQTHKRLGSDILNLLSSNARFDILRLRIFRGRHENLK